MTKPVHHLIAKKADRLGVEFASITDESVVLRRKEDGFLATIEGATASEALEAMESGEAEFAPEKALKFKCGVMPAGHHARYMAQGGGCADVLDQTMRELFLTDDGLNLAALKETGEANGVWNPLWERLNPGMQRMNLANRLRSRVRHGYEVSLIVDGHTTTGTFGIQPLAKPAKAAKAEKPAKPSKKPAKAPKLATAQPEA